MHRREFVAGTVTGIVAAGAGCATASGAHRLSVDPFDSAHVAYAVDELAPDQRAALETIREEGAEVTLGRHPFGRPGEKGYVELDDGFYRVRTERTGEEPQRRDILFARPDDSAEAAAEAVPAAEVYSEADHERIVEAVEPATHDEHNYAARYIFRSVGKDESDLLYEPEYEFVEVEVDETFDRTRVFRLQVIAGTVVEPVYTTTIEPVADAEIELARHLDDENLVHRIDDAQLTADQREVIETAVDDGTYTESQSLVGDDEPFDGLTLAPRRDPETDRPYRILRYDDEYHTWSVDYTDGE